MTQPTQQHPTWYVLLLNVLVLGGIILTVAGLWWICPPAALVVLGVLLMTAGLLGGRT